MYYNKDLFEKAGITAPPETWEELKAAAAKIKALGGEVYGFGLQGKEIETDVYFYYAMWSHGAISLRKTAPRVSTAKRRSRRRTSTRAWLTRA
jgi:multiple sugar transport system substrate-binding protein